MSNITGRHPAKGGNGGLQTRTPPAPFGGQPFLTYYRLFFGPPRSVFWRVVFGFSRAVFLAVFCFFFGRFFLASLTEASGFGRYHLMGSKYPPSTATH